MDGFFEAYSALEARMKIVDIITNNLANVQTTGFKRDFGHVLQGETEFDVGTQIDLAPGDLITTGNELDAAIDGPGFFTIDTPNGLRYTRAGSFSLDAEGKIVTKDGMTVMGVGNSPITVSDGHVAIQDGGIVTVDGSAVATLRIVTFPGTQLLQKEGAQRLSWAGEESDAQEVPEPRVKGGHLERSNVNAVTEMVNLMVAYREFEAVQRTAKTLMTDMNSKLIQELGRLT